MQTSDEAQHLCGCWPIVRRTHAPPNSVFEGSGEAYTQPQISGRPLAPSGRAWSRCDQRHPFRPDRGTDFFLSALGRLRPPRPFDPARSKRLGVGLHPIPGRPLTTLAVIAWGGEKNSALSAREWAAPRTRHFGCRATSDARNRVSHSASATEDFPRRRPRAPDRACARGQTIENDGGWSSACRACCRETASVPQ